MIELTGKEIDHRAMYERLCRECSGSVVFHYAVVKDVAEGKRTAGISFAADGDLEGELRGLEENVRKKWKIEDFILIRRLGDLKIGDMIMAVGISAEGRDDAFGACRDAVDGCKKLKCIGKKELYTDS